jgi:hypothetical protein
MTQRVTTFALVSAFHSESYLASRCHRVRKSYTTAKRCHSPGTPLSS